MKIFITGGSGFLGRATIKKLVKNGETVFALGRSAESCKIVEELGAKSIVGDILYPSGFAKALSGVDVVVHCAAPVKIWGSWVDFHQEIVVASRNLVQACVEEGVKRFIYISSEAVLQDSRSLFNIDESLSLATEPNSYYGKAKGLAEISIQELAHQIEIVILRPTFIYGPDCPSVSTILAKAAMGQFVWINQGKSPFEAVHVDNVAHSILKSLKNGPRNSSYLITDGVHRTVRQFFEDLFIKNGTPIPTRSVPLQLAIILAKVFEFLWKWMELKNQPPLTKFEVAFVSQPRSYRISKAMSELGYAPLVEVRGVGPA